MLVLEINNYEIYEVMLYTQNILKIIIIYIKKKAHIVYYVQIFPGIEYMIFSFSI